MRKLKDVIDQPMLPPLPDVLVSAIDAVIERQNRIVEYLSKVQTGSLSEKQVQKLLKELRDVDLPFGKP